MSDTKTSSREKKLKEMLLPIFKKGYAKSEIYEALHTVEDEYQTEKDHPGFLGGKITGSHVLLFIGGAITVLGGFFLVAVNWSYWNSFSRILAIFIPFFVVLGIATLLKRGKENTQGSTAFAVTSALLFPLLLMVFFNETKLFSAFHDSIEGFTYSLISTTYFIAMAIYFRSVVWSLLYTISIFVGYFFLFDYFKFDILGPNTVFWGVLTLGLLFFGYCYLLYKQGKAEHGRYAILVTLAISLFSIIFMLSTHHVSSVATWYLIVPTAIYFFVAGFMETEEYEDLARIIYFLGSFTLFLMLMKLSFGGRLINLYGAETELGISIFNITNEGAVGGSLAISGLIFLGLSYLFQYIKKHNFHILSSFSVFFELVGTWFGLGGILLAGLGGKKIFLELLLGAASLLSIYFSTVKQSKIYLYSGTIFLIIFIFDLGGEYFGDTLGWPVTLLISGIISMGIGYSMGRIQKQFGLITEEK